MGRFSAKQISAARSDSFDFSKFTDKYYQTPRGDATEGEIAIGKRVGEGMP